MKKYLGIFLAVVVLATMLVVPVVKADTLDQSNSSGSTGIGFGESNNLKYSCQGFKPTSNQVTAVSFKLNSVGSAGMKLWVDAAGTNSAPTGTLEVGLGSMEIANNQLSTTLTKYTLPTPIFVTPNAQYTFCLAPWNTTTHTYSSNYRDLMSSTGNPYANGKVVNYVGSTSTWSNPDNGNADRIFEVYGNNVSPTITSFTAADTTIDEGDSTTLSWVASNYTSLSIDNGVGTVTTSPVTVSPTVTTTYTLTATNTVGNTTSQASITVVPLVTPTWELQSVDVMKYSKDVLCSPPTTTFVDAQLDKAVDIGANFVAVSGYYDEPSCNSTGAITTLTRWVEGARAHDLHVWFRFKNKAFEGDYSTTKSTSPDGMRHQKLMVDWIAAHANLIEEGDIFTPNAEPQNGGINGVTFCAASVCQFTGKADFNLWLRQTHTMADLAIKAQGFTNVKIGYYGFDGFIVAGLGNPDWQGQSQLEASTIAMMGNVAIDHYPETIGHTLEQDLPYIKTAIGSTTPIIISEYGYISSGTESARAAGVTAFMEDAAAEPNVDGFNYWHFGPGGNEGLLGGSSPSFTETLLFDAVEAFYK